MSTYNCSKKKSSIVNLNNFTIFQTLRISLSEEVCCIQVKEKIGCCNNLDSKIWHSIFIWLQQPIFGYNSKFLILLAYPQVSVYDFDRLTQLKICCHNQKLVAAAI